MTARCPACGDPGPFGIWIDPEPPQECPFEAGRVSGLCHEQIRRAQQKAALRRAAPQCFDANGNMLPGRSGEAWMAYIKAGGEAP